MARLTALKRNLGRSPVEVAASAALKTVIATDPSNVVLTERRKRGQGGLAVSACGLIKRVRKQLTDDWTLVHHQRELGDDHKKRNCGR